ncbi:MAG: IS4 family transposase, partial [Parachlamydiaceae bacterium]|nr:IS4 family transposase [Parachlamydiaceae bacterium]
MKHSLQIIQFLDENFNEKKCHETCRQYKFIQRSTSKLRGYEFIRTMIMPSEGVSTDSLKGLCQRMREINPKADLSSQALCERINDASSSRLMKGVFALLLCKIHEHITISCPKLTLGLEGFRRVLLQDSTVVTLNTKLEEIYKGTRRGNSCIKAQVKIDLIHDLSKGVLIDAKIFRGNEPDQGLAKRVLDYIKTGDLIIRDLGYFSMAVFAALIKINAYFLSRLLPRVNFYLNKNDAKALDLGEYLRDKKFKNRNIINLEGYIGEEKIWVRLIIYRQTEEVTNQRLRAAHKGIRKKGQTMSKSKRLLLNFSVFITNAPESMLSMEMVGTAYRLRWEIELIFKRWKSQLNIDYLKGIHKERVDCLIWSRLCTAIILELIIGYFKKGIAESHKVEVSEVKLIQYMLRGNKFCLAMSMNNLENFFLQMEKDITR